MKTKLALIYSFYILFANLVVLFFEMSARTLSIWLHFAASILMGLILFGTIWALKKLSFRGSSILVSVAFAFICVTAFTGIGQWPINPLQTLNFFWVQPEFSLGFIAMNAFVFSKIPKS